MTGLAHHRVLDVEQVVAVLDADQTASGPTPAVVRPVWDWAAANQRKIDAVQQLAPLADALDDIEARIDDLIVSVAKISGAHLPHYLSAVPRRCR